MPSRRDLWAVAGERCSTTSACSVSDTRLVREYKVYFVEAPHYLGVSFITALVPKFTQSVK